MNTINKSIQIDARALRGLGMSGSIILAQMIKLGCNKDDAKEFVTKEGWLRSSEGATFDETLAWLGESMRTEKEFYTWLVKEGSPNECRWVRDRNKVRKLINDVRAAASEIEWTEDEASDVLVKKVKAKVPAAKTKNLI